MAKKRKKLAALLVAAGIFASLNLAAEEVKLIKDPKAIVWMIRALEHKNPYMVMDNVLEFRNWHGTLSNHDVVLMDHLVGEGIYNMPNAETYVRSLSQDNVSDLITILGNDKLSKAVRAVTITTMRTD